MIIRVVDDYHEFIKEKFWEYLKKKYRVESASEIEVAVYKKERKYFYENLLPTEEEHAQWQKSGENG